MCNGGPGFESRIGPSIIVTEILVRTLVRLAAVVEICPEDIMITLRHVVVSGHFYSLFFFILLFK